MPAFQPGTVVRLKSGGSLMTVYYCAPEASGELWYRCLWHDYEGQPQGETYPACVLETQETT